MIRLTDILKNTAGEFEIGRTLLTSGAATAIVSPIGFQTWDMLAHAAHFDVAAWCTSYPAGLAALVGTGVYAIGKKERDVAVAKQTQAATDTAVAAAAVATEGGA